MQQPSTTSNGETSLVEVAASTSHDPESANVDDDADTKMASANNSIAEDMSISTLSVELGESETRPPNNVDTARADQQQEETSVPAAAAVDETSARPIDESAAGPSSHHSEGKVDVSDDKASSDSEPARSLPTFPALPSSGEVSDTPRQEPQGPASSPAKSTAEDVATSASTSGQQQKLETQTSPSVTITKRPKPGSVNSSSKLRAANMPNNPNRSDGNSNSTASTATTNATATAPAANVTPLRRGKWTKEEEEYAAKVIQMFNAGYLPAPAGTTLRAYLSDKLHCDPMRITKKFTGSSCIGKRVFHPAVRCAENAAAMDSAQKELVSLEKTWRKRLKLKKRSSRRSSSKREPKAATSSAMSATSLPSTSTSETAGTVGHHANPTTITTNPSTTGIVSPPAVSPPSEEWSAGSSSLTYATGAGTQQEATGTTSKDSSIPIPQPSAAHHHGASWIDRAHALLANSGGSSNNGPSSENSYARRKVSDSSHVSNEDGTGKEHRQTVSPNIAATVTPSEAKDAEALVGFLNSVRAEAASGGL